MQRLTLRKPSWMLWSGLSVLVVIADANRMVQSVSQQLYFNKSPSSKAGNRPLFSMMVAAVAGG